LSTLVDAVKAEIPGAAVHAIATIDLSGARNSKLGRIILYCPSQTAIALLQ
jgi:hypothetical protein